MNEHHLKVSDYVAASVPATASVAAKTLAAFTLADWNHIVGMCSTLMGAVLGASYLIWKWRREAKKCGSKAPCPLINKTSHRPHGHSRNQ